MPRAARQQWSGRRILMQTVQKSLGPNGQMWKWENHPTKSWVAMGQWTAPAPLRAGTASNTTRRRASKRTSGDAGLDLYSDIHPNSNPNPAVDEDRDPRAPEKENTIRRRLRGPAATTRSKKATPANTASSGTGPVRKVAATPRPVVATEPTVEPGKVGGAAGRLLAAASSAVGRGEMATTNY